MRQLSGKEIYVIVREKGSPLSFKRKDLELRGLEFFLDFIESVTLGIFSFVRIHKIFSLFYSVRNISIFSGLSRKNLLVNHSSGERSRTAPGAAVVNQSLSYDFIRHHRGKHDPPNLVRYFVPHRHDDRRLR